MNKKISPPSDKIESPVAAFVALERYNAIKLVQVKRMVTAINIYVCT